MWHLTLCFIAVSWLLVASSFGANTTPNLSDLDKQAATDAAEVEKVSAVAAPNETVTDYSRYRMAEESNRLILALSIMAAGVFSLLIVLAYLKSIGAAADLVVTGSGLVLVVFATVLIVILVKRDEQLTAATGILGAIAGYLFGKSAKNSDSEQKPAKEGMS